MIRGTNWAHHRFVRSRHIFAGQLGASYEVASGRLLPGRSDERHFLEQNRAKLNETQPGGGAIKALGQRR